MRITTLLITAVVTLSADFAWSQSTNSAARLREQKRIQRENGANSRFNGSFTGVHRHTRSPYRQSDWKQRLADSQRAQYSRQGGGNYPPDGYGPAPVYNGYSPYYGGAPFFGDANDYADIYYGKRYYEDGPNGPGYYYKDRWYNWYIATKRGNQLEDANRESVDVGLSQFRAGQYDRAAVTWLNASTLDHGDAASRLQAGHALFALGRYEQAVQLLARAFELAPQLAGAGYDIRSDYGNIEDFNRQFAQLSAHVSSNPHDVAALTLIGYVISYTDGPSHAYDYLGRAWSLNPNDTFIEKLWSIAATVGRAQQAPQAPPPPAGQMTPIPPAAPRVPNYPPTPTPMPRNEPAPMKQTQPSKDDKAKPAPETMHLVIASPHH